MHPTLSPCLLPPMVELSIKLMMVLGWWALLSVRVKVLRGIEEEIWEPVFAFCVHPVRNFLIQGLFFVGKMLNIFVKTPASCELCWVPHLIWFNLPQHSLLGRIHKLFLTVLMNQFVAHKLFLSCLTLSLTAISLSSRNCLRSGGYKAQCPIRLSTSINLELSGSWKFCFVGCPVLYPCLE